MVTEILVNYWIDYEEIEPRIITGNCGEQKLVELIKKYMIDAEIISKINENLPGILQENIEKYTNNRKDDLKEQKDSLKKKIQKISVL
jgi:hypothetical protein